MKKVCDVCKNEATYIEDDVAYCAGHSPIGYAPIKPHTPPVFLNNNRILREDIDYLKKLGDMMIADPHGRVTEIGNRLGVIVDHLMSIDSWYVNKFKGKKK